MQPQQTNNSQTDQSAQPAAASAPQNPMPQANTPSQQNTGDKQQSTPVKKHNPNSTQNSLQVAELRENMAVMNDGSFRVVVACKSINFDLMSSVEREAVEFSYQSFLNSLYFPAQILIRSQRVDIGPYLDRLEKIRRTQENMLLGVLMDDYIDFIDGLAQEANIMDKSFYIIIPYYPTGDVDSVVNNSRSMLGALFKPQQQNVVKINQKAYEKAKDEMKNHADAVMSGLFQMGVHAAQLNTKEIGELLYSFYNPDTAVHESLGDFEKYTNTFIRKGEGEASQPHLREDSI